jgi:DNA adenine methylase
MTMSDCVFKYPGGKTQLFSWIADRIPQHRTWVDVFGGSGVVTANKSGSEVEVYNDLDGDLVHFFVTLRDSQEELAEWLEQTPHSRQLQLEYGKEFYDGHRPDDDIERAGRFFYLRYTQFAAKYTSISGYNGGKKRSAADSYQQAINRLEQWQERFKHVQIEQLDFEDLIERYDSEQTFFYCDPPYMDEGDDLYSHDGGFEHGRFVDALTDSAGDWMVSYTRVPEPLRDAAVCIDEQDRHVRMRQGQDDWEKTNTERLIMNYDPTNASMFRQNGQSALQAYS